MLAKPSVNDLMKKVGNRYEVALTVAKRARQISAKRLVEGDPDITDAVDIASNELNDGDVNIIKD